MDDDQIHAEIEQLEEEERKLRHDEAQAAEAGRPEIIEAARVRLQEIRVRLDQLWDLHRQREAARRSGSDPEDRTMRDPGTVEGYLG